MAPATPNLLGIPTELRILSLKYLLPPTGKVHIRSLLGKPGAADLDENNCSFYRGPYTGAARSYIASSRKQTLPDIAILCVCREICNEGTEVLYTQNEFRFRPRSAENQYVLSYHQIASFYQWVHDIGQKNASLLRKVSILLPDIVQNLHELDHYPPETLHRAPYRYTDIDMSMVLDFLWNHPNCDVQFRYDRSSAATSIVIGRLARAGDPYVYNTYKLTNMLKQLTQQKSTFEKFNPWPKMISFIVSADALDGYIVYRLCPQTNTWTQHFALSDSKTKSQDIRRRWAERNGTGPSLQRLHSPEPGFEAGSDFSRTAIVYAKPLRPELPRLPNRVLSRIYQFALGMPKDITINLPDQSRSHERMFEKEEYNDDDREGPLLDIDLLPPCIKEELRPFKANSKMYEAAKCLFLAHNTLIFHWNIQHGSDLTALLWWIGAGMNRLEHNNSAWSITQPRTSNIRIVIEQCMDDNPIPFTK